jgi:5-(carboxyamino)imidazole ribonucleotide mutase
MKKPVVGIIMGSDSDLLIMQEAATTCEEFGIPYELTIVSAHRTPDRLFSYASSAQKRGLKVLIAGAGGAAHLPGMTASLTPLPVIGVPVKGKNLEGLDSLLSIVQMPPGIPVATVAINASKNAGLLAVRILALEDKPLQHKLEQVTLRLNKEVKARAKKLEGVGHKRYLSDYEHKK